jgi:hypothetical protein
MPHFHVIRSGHGPAAAEGGAKIKETPAQRPDRETSAPLDPDPDPGGRESWLKEGLRNGLLGLRDLLDGCVSGVTPM